MSDDKPEPGTDIVPAEDSYVGKFLADFEADEEAVVGLTDKQRQVFKLKLRGFTQKAIGEVMSISQPAVAKHWKAIQHKFSDIGATIDQNQVVGESATLFQEIEQRAWELFYTAKNAGKLGDANKALSTIMEARERSLELFMDLGIIKRAAIEHDHNVTVSPLIESWRKGDAQAKLTLPAQVIETQLEPLDEPMPPIEDAEFFEMDELDEPTPDDND